MRLNPWQSRFLATGGIDRYACLEQRAVAQTLRGDSIPARAQFLKVKMGEVFLCGDQASLLLDQLLSIGEGHALAHYGSFQQVLGAIYDEHPWGENTQPALMLTGLAGVGKTELIKATRRLFADRLGRVDLPGHPNFEIVPAWFMSLKDCKTLNALLGPFIDPVTETIAAEKIPLKKDLKQTQLLQLARRVSRRRGVCMIFLDEFQFISHSTQASAWAMALLLNMLSVGPRVVYVANFSLAWRLKSRRPEDRHRVLANHFELRPDAVDSLDFLNYVNELTRIAPQDFRFEASAVADLVHRYSFGIKRAVVELLVGAWEHAKKVRGARADVTESDLKAAYASSGYFPFRSDSEELKRYSIGCQDIDPGLLNPLAVEKPADNVVVAQAAISDFNRRANERHLEGMLTPAEKDALSKLAPPKKASTAENRVRALPRHAASKDALLDAFNRLAKDL